MSFTYRFRKSISLAVIFAFTFGITVTPAEAVYDPVTGRYLQRDPNGTALLIQATMHYQGDFPMVTVSPAYELQYGDGMNFYEYTQSTPPNRTDPSGLFSYADVSGGMGIQGDMFGHYADMAVSTVDALKGVAFLQNERSAVIDDIISFSDDAFDFSGIDRGIAYYDAYQVITFKLTVGYIGFKVARGVVGLGRRAFRYFANRAGGRRALLETLDAGTSAQREFFGIGTAPVTVGSKLSREASDALRTEARAIWERATGRRAVWDNLQIHHRVPLEWSHVLGRADPNRLSNLVGVDAPTHVLINNEWNAWKRSLAGRTPSQVELMEQVLKIDDMFSDAWVFPK
ncbi:MAG: hypothetical protein J5J06_09615 [Phycisphaerae bacterium]|nr:hypothetical protein [Phycisphaerae bacterium]